MKIGFRQRVINSVAWVTAGTGARAAMRLLVLSIMARLMGPADFGLAAAAAVIVGMFEIMIFGGLGQVLVRRTQFEPEQIRVAFGVSLIVGLTTSVGVGWSADELARVSFGIPGLGAVLRVLAAALFFRSIGQVGFALLQRRLAFQRIVSIDLGSYFVGYGVVGLTLAANGFGAWSLILAYVVQEVVRSLTLIRASRHGLKPKFSPRIAAELFSLSGGFALATFGNWLARNGDRWVVGRWLGEEALGFYRYACDLTAMVGQQIGAVLDQVLFPAMSKVQENPDKLAGAYRQGVGLIGLVLHPLSATLFVLAPELIGVIMGPGWETTVVPFQIFSLALLLRTTYKLSDTLAKSTGAAYRRAWRQYVYATAILLFSWLGQHAGLTGLSLGVVAAVAVHALIQARFSMDLASLSWRSVAAAHLGGVPSFLLAFAVVGSCASFARDAEWPPIAVLASSLAPMAAAMIVAIRLFPTLMFGSDGYGAISVLRSYLESRLPSLAESRLFSLLLPPAAVKLDR